MNVELFKRVGQFNPGALNVVGALLTSGKEDAVAALDGAGIRGPAVWVAFNDVHGRNHVALADAAINDIESLKRKLAELGYAPEERAK